MKPSTATVHVTIRLAQAQDIPLLDGVERSASTLFSVFSNAPPTDRTVPPGLLKTMQNRQLLWVAADQSDVPIGFVGCRNLDDMWYVHELSVCRDFQRLGIGRRLMLTVMDLAAKRRVRRLGLTTDRAVPWNKPFYQTLGFREMVDAQECLALWSKLQEEIREGADANTRCAMIR